MNMTIFIHVILLTLAFAANDRAGAEPPIVTAKVINTYPHDDQAFTQGLFFAGDQLIETTGHYGRSQLRALELESGVVQRAAALPDRVFGEGAALVGDQIFSLTWRAGVGFIHRASDFEKIGEFPVRGEGWGLTYDGERLILTDGGDRLTFIDPETFQVLGDVRVTYKGKPVTRLNELEWIDGAVFANVWKSDFIIRIDPNSGKVTQLIDVSALFPMNERGNPRDDVPNGIAFHQGERRLFVTAKNGPRLYEIELPSAP